MALQLSLKQFPGKLFVYVENTGNNTVIIEEIIISIDWDGGSWMIWRYQDDFYRTSSVQSGFWGVILEMPFFGGGTGEVAHATANYWEVDQSVKSPNVNLT